MSTQSELFFHLLISAFQMKPHFERVLTALSSTFSDPSDNVILINARVVATIIKDPNGVVNVQYFRDLIKNLLEIFRKSSPNITQRERYIVR